MGVNLRDLIEPREMQPESLSGKAVAVDALNIIYQFLSTIRDRFTGEPLKDSSGSVTSHLSGIFYRTARMIETGIVPVYVFDGKPPEFKRGTQLERQRIRDDARQKLKDAVEAGDREKIRLYSQQAVSVTDQMLSEAKELLNAMGIQCIDAPSEGEAQASYMNGKGVVYACGSQDWDSLLFGAERLVRNLAVTGRRKLPGKETYVKVDTEMIELREALSALSITREQLVMLGILVGTDYNPGGVRGIGPKKALYIVREKKDLDSVMSGLEWGFEPSPNDIFSFFMSPPVSDVGLRAPVPDMGRVRDILSSHDFSAERVKNTLEKFTASKEKAKQSSLQKFF